MAAHRPRPLAAVILCACLAGGVVATAPPVSAAPTLAAEEASNMAGRMAGWIVRSGDNEDLPFAVIDKNAGMVFVFDANGKQLGSDAALMGIAFGDESVEGIGDRRLADIKPEERTTPAGRFVGGYGPAIGYEEDILWIDFETALSIHPVVTGNPEEMRVTRLKSASQHDNRITYGCINVSNDFYDEVIAATFKKTQGVFYVLPDTKYLDDVFPEFAQAMAADEKMASAKPPKRRLPFWPW